MRLSASFDFLRLTELLFLFRRGPAFFATKISRRFRGCFFALQTHYATPLCPEYEKRDDSKSLAPGLLFNVSGRFFSPKNSKAM